MQESVRLLLDVREFGRDRLSSDSIVRDATIRRLEVIGEAAGHVSEGVRRRYPEIPWRRMHGFSSFAKHEYWRLDLNQIWRILEELPTIDRALARVRVRDVGPG